MPQTNGYAQPSYSSRYNPEPQSLPYSGQHFHLPDIQDQFEPTGLPNWDGSREVKAPAVVPVPSSSKHLFYLEERKCSLAVSSNARPLEW